MLHPGLRLGSRYRLDERIGAGGMGEVWRGHDEVLGRVVAIKAMLPAVAGEPGFAARFRAEAKAMAGVNHPAVTSIHDYGTDAGVTYLVMEFVNGQSLAQLLRTRDRLGPDETMRLIEQAATGLQAVHDQGIVHRDIKPANLMVRADGALLITDFGISRTAGSTQLTASGAILGTPTYLSPEQVLGQPATPLSDVYSLGLTAYECLAGQRPFAGDNPYAVALQRLQAAPRTLTGSVPAGVLAVVERALATEPGDRWPDAAALADAARTARSPVHVDAAGAGRPAGVRGAVGAAAGKAGPAAPPRRARRMRVVALAVALVVAVGAVWALNRTTGPSGQARGGPASGGGTSVATVAGGDFAACGAGLCPVRPFCWGGMTVVNGQTVPPLEEDCTAAHTWETFAALPSPVDPSRVRQQILAARADVAGACSAAVLKARSRGPALTAKWIRDAYPIRTAAGAWLVHCVARLDGADSTRAYF